MFCFPHYLVNTPIEYIVQYFFEYGAPCWIYLNSFNTYAEAENVAKLFAENNGPGSVRITCLGEIYGYIKMRKQ